MDLVNAISKARFSAAKPQRIQLHKGRSLVAELLCMEAGQQINVDAGEWAYYVIAGAGRISVAEQQAALPAGQMAAPGPGQPHVLANVGEQRLVCLAVTSAK